MLPKAVNHAGKLLKELQKAVGIRPAEVKQLRILADASDDQGTPLDNPLVLLLCPSLLAKTMRGNPPRVDRKIVGGIAKRLGVKR